MIDPKILTLVEKLSVMTRDKGLSWERTSRNTEYEVLLNKGKITVDSWVITDDFDEYQGESADLAIYNDDGERTDYIQFDKRKHPEDYQALNDLYKIVNRSYLRADETLDELIDELDSLKF